MKKQLFKLLSLIIAVSVFTACVIPAGAGGNAFAERAYANIVTFSDCQNIGPVAYNNFGKVLKVMRDDGMPEPDSVLVGGDYSLILGDYATPGIIQLREHYQSVYPNADPDDIICAQGNHDLKIPAFYPSGMYDMGTYCLYLINEDDFPWLQFIRNGAEDTVKNTAADIKTALDKMISGGDTRPVIFITHVPLHHTTRNFCGDNMYSSYIFNVINEAAAKLDIIFLFAHNHSGDHDDYIGGSVNFMAPGDKVRIPMADKRGEDCYTEEKLNFTYTNCGYIGFDRNHETETSTNVLTLGAIRFFKNKFVFLKYTQDGLFRQYEIERIHKATSTETAAQTQAKNMQRNDSAAWNRELRFLEPIIRMFMRFFSLMG